MSFVLTALFVVLTIEQYFSSEARFPFIAAVGAGALSLILFSPDNMLLASIILGTLILIVRDKSIQRTQREQKMQKTQETEKTQEMKKMLGVPQINKEIRSINTSIQPVEDKIKEEN
jgi:type III secretory pathway component EscU